MDLREIGWDGMVWIGLIWLRIGTSGGLSWTRSWTSRFHKMLGSSRVAAQLAVSQEGLSSMSEWVICINNSDRCFWKTWLNTVTENYFSCIWH
jgi:hypothetical protein